MQIAQQQRAPFNFFPFFCWRRRDFEIGPALRYIYIKRRERKEGKNRTEYKSRDGLTVGVVKNRIIWMARHQSNI